MLLKEPSKDVFLERVRRNLGRTNLLLKGLEFFVFLFAVLFDFFLGFGACVFYTFGAV